MSVLDKDLIMVEQAMLKRMQLTPAHIQSLVTRASQTPSVEVCGLLGGRFDWRMTTAAVRTVHSIENVASTPQTRFKLAPKEQIATLMAILSAGDELVGIFHSHPAGPPHPSATDKAECAYPNVAYCILFPTDAGVQGEHIVSWGGWQLGAWRLKGQQMTPVSIQVEFAA